MPRIAGVDIPKEKQICIALTRIFGIGRSKAAKIAKQANVEPTKNAEELSDDEVIRVRNIVENKETVEGELREKRKKDIQRLKETGTYRGKRHKEGLPVRGQQTQTNSRTVRGNVRQTVATGQHRGMEKK